MKKILLSMVFGMVGGMALGCGPAAQAGGAAYSQPPAVPGSGQQQSSAATSPVCATGTNGVTRCGACF